MNVVLAAMLDNVPGIRGWYTLTGGGGGGNDSAGCT